MLLASRINESIFKNAHFNNIQWSILYYNKKIKKIHIQKMGLTLVHKELRFRVKNVKEQIKISIPVIARFRARYNSWNINSLSLPSPSSRWDTSPTEIEYNWRWMGKSRETNVNSYKIQKILLTTRRTERAGVKRRYPPSVLDTSIHIYHISS